MISQVGSKHHQLSSAQQRTTHSSASSAAYVALAQQRSAVQCRPLACPGVACRAVRCGTAVRCCSVLLFECHTTGTIAVRTRYYMLNHKKMLAQLSSTQL